MENGQQISNESIHLTEQQINCSICMHVIEDENTVLQRSHESEQLA